MSNTLPSANMNMPIPVVGVDPGPDWALNVNNSLTILDGHNHSPGSGVQINPNGLDINSDLTFLNNNATNLRSVRFQPQSAVLSGGLDVGCLYEVTNDLYYNDGLGNQIRFTQSGSIVGSPGTITGLPSGTASASFSAGTFVFQASTLTGANIDVASIILRNNVSSSFGLTLSPPTLGSDYQITLPQLPVSSGILRIDNTGAMSSNLVPDGTSIIISGNQLVAPAGVNYSREHCWEVNGRYGGLTFPQNAFDGVFIAPYNITINSMWIENDIVGTSGTTEFDLKVATTSGGSYSTILSTTGKITSAAASGVWTDSGSVIGAQTGVTKPVVSTSAISAGSAIRMDLITGMVGANGARVRIWFQQA